MKIRIEHQSIIIGLTHHSYNIHSQHYDLFFLDALEKQGWALPEKCEDIKQWVERNDIIHLVNNISRFKFPFDGEILGAKVYLLHEPSQILLLPRTAFGERTQQLVTSYQAYLKY